LDPSVVHPWDREHEHREAGDAGQDRARSGGGTADRRQGPPLAFHGARPPNEVLAQPPFASVSAEVRQAGEIARHPRVELRASRDRSFGRTTRTPPRAQGHGHPTDREERKQDEPKDGFEHRDDRTRERHREDRGRGRHEAAHEERVERVDVGHGPREEVAAPERPEPPGRQRLDRAEEPDPDLGEHPEGGEVNDVPLRIAEGRAGDREPSDRSHGHRDRREPRDERGPGDQVGRRGHQGDVRSERAEARQRGQEHPTPYGCGEFQQPAQRGPRHGRPSTAIGATRPFGAS
jgi:hypothetical protein